MASLFHFASSSALIDPVYVQFGFIQCGPTQEPPGGGDCSVSPGGASRAAGGAVEEEDGACKHRNMAAERGAGDGHIDDNMGNELQLLAAGNARTRTPSSRPANC